MFYCEGCRVKNDWPDGYALSRGKCEVCGKNAVCYDVHHSLLKGTPSLTKGVSVSSNQHDNTDENGGTDEQ
jgi:uncharacterized protein YeaC (DUF1315 family)